MAVLLLLRKHRPPSNIMHRMDPSEWVAGAFSLFIDFINMFIRVLILLTGRRD